MEFTEVSERRDDTYLEPNLKKRQKNNEKAIEDMNKMGTHMKNPHFGNGPTGSMASEEKDKKAPTPQQRLNRDAGKMASKKLKQREHEKYVNFLPHDEEVQWVANTAAEYFIEEGLNEDGIEILIEELGLESFVEYVYELGEEIITEARAGGVRVEPVTKTGKSVGSLKGGARSSAIKRLRKEKQARRDSESGSSKPSGMTAALKSQSDRAKAVDTAKKQQPKKRGLLDRVGDAVVKGIERHNKAMATAKKLSNETGKTLKKAGKVAGAVAKGAGEGVKMAGNAAKVAHKVATEEVEVDEAVVYGGTPAKKEKLKDKRKLVTRADKLGNTPAYQRLTSGDKNYKAANHLTDHMNVDELYKGKHGQSEKEYQDSRSDAGKLISGDSKGSGANYSYKAKNTGPNPAGGSEKPQGQARMSNKDREYLRYRKANMSTNTEEMSPLKERLKAVYEVTSPYIVDEGYRVISTSFKHGDGHPDDDITIKREKKVVSGDNLTKKGAKRSQERRGREYGSQGAFQVQKTREAKKRSSNAPSADKVKADINKKEKQREKTSYNRKIDGMNRAGTPSGKVAAARLRGMKKIDATEEVAIENIQGGPIMPGEKGKKVYPKKDQPKKTGAKLPKINPIDERTRYAKETGKDFKTGNSSERGGTRTGKSAFDKVSSELRKTGGLMSSRGNAIPPQGKKKVKGEKDRKGVTPVDKIKGKLSKQRAPKPEIGSRFD